MFVKPLKDSKSAIFAKKIGREKSIFYNQEDIESVSNMHQSVQNIMISDRKHILDLNKSHKSSIAKNTPIKFPAAKMAGPKIPICKIQIQIKKSLCCTVSYRAVSKKRARFVFQIKLPKMYY